MLGRIVHVGLTVSDMDRSIKFYRDVLGLTFQGEVLMEGPETEILFGMPGVKARVAYLNGSDIITAPPVELIELTESEKKTPEIFHTSISEICFEVSDIDSVYEKLGAMGVEFLSAPQKFDFTKDGFGKSKAVYFKDPDGIILELMEVL